ncbi:MAG: hypothetical protein NUV88_03400 [Candidatus Kaiserbacteria bacterium]|nr:hypothetical protein [Candidatus Kaiserbacteria bacterium]
MKTKTGKKVTALLTGVLLLGVTTASVFAASGRVHEGAVRDPLVIAQMGMTSEQMAKMDAHCSPHARTAVTEDSTQGLRYDAEDGWVAD